MSLIELTNINKIYKKGNENKVHALKDVTLQIEKGELVGLVGVSGSGKSTLLHILGCLDKFDSGEYYFNGDDVKKYSDKKLAKVRNEEIGFVLQSFGLILGNTVYNNIALPQLLSSKTKVKEIEPRIDLILKNLGIFDKKNNLVESLSGGQQQRVAIARAMINKPQLILADEPTGSLDRSTSKDMMDILHSLNKEEGVTIIIATHDPFIYEQCQRIIRIDDGRITTE